MKLLLLTFTFLLSLSSFAQAGKYTVTAETWPKNVEEFDTFRTQHSVTPEGAVVSLLAALDIYSKNPEVGKHCLVLVLDSKHLFQSHGVASYKGFDISKNTMSLVQRQIEQNPHLTASYLPGSNYKSGYVPLQPPYLFNLTANKYSGNKTDGKIKLYIPSSGADSPRPVTVSKNSKDVWKVSEFSSILVGVRKPIQQNPADEL
jgi:hypothetical protein